MTIGDVSKKNLTVSGNDEDVLKTNKPAVIKRLRQRLKKIGRGKKEKAAAIEAGTISSHDAMESLSIGASDENKLV